MSGLFYEAYEVMYMLISSYLYTGKHYCMDYISSGLLVLIKIFRFLFQCAHFPRIVMFKPEA